MKTNYNISRWKIVEVTAFFFAPVKYENDDFQQNFATAILFIMNQIFDKIKTQCVFFFFKILYFAVSTETKQKQRRSTYQLSLGSGRLRWIEIKSDAYWLNAFFIQPSSTDFFISADIFVGSITGLPISPGASGEFIAGGINTPLSDRIYKISIIFFEKNAHKPIEIRNLMLFICLNWMVSIDHKNYIRSECNRLHEKWSKDNELKMIIQVN